MLKGLSSFKGTLLQLKFRVRRDTEAQRSKLAQLEQKMADSSGRNGGLNIE